MSVSSGLTKKSQWQTQVPKFSAQGMTEILGVSVSGLKNL
jgi:hypothetical protein